MTNHTMEAFVIDTLTNTKATLDDVLETMKAAEKRVVALRQRNAELVSALHSAATSLDQAAYTLEARGIHDKASLYRLDAKLAHAAVKRAEGNPL